MMLLMITIMVVTVKINLVINGNRSQRRMLMVSLLPVMTFGLVLRQVQQIILNIFKLMVTQDLPSIQNTKKCFVSTLLNLKRTRQPLQNWIIN